MSDLKLQGIDKDGNEKEYSLNDFKGSKIVLYFYPKDKSCTYRFLDNVFPSYKGYTIG